MKCLHCAITEFKYTCTSENALRFNLKAFKLSCGGMPPRSPSIGIVAYMYKILRDITFMDFAVVKLSKVSSSKIKSLLYYIALCQITDRGVHKYIFPQERF